MVLEEFLDQLAETREAFDRGAAAREGEKLLDEALRLEGGLLGGLQFGHAVGVAAQTHFREREIAEQDGEEVVEVVRESAGEKAEGFEAVHAALALGFFAARGDVLDEKQETLGKGIAAQLEPGLLFLEVQFAVHGLAMEHRVGERFVVGFTRRGGHEFPEVRAEKCLACFFKHAQGAAVGVNEAPAAVERDERIGDALDDVDERSGSGCRRVRRSLPCP